jgi:hypothetical protein
VSFVSLLLEPSLTRLDRDDGVIRKLARHLAPSSCQLEQIVPRVDPAFFKFSVARHGEKLTNEVIGELTQEYASRD